MSRSAFAARFKLVVGQTPFEYLTHWRMYKAGMLMRKHGTSLSEVAHAVGYESESAFNRVFKRSMGAQLPESFDEVTEYRKFKRPFPPPASPLPPCRPPAPPRRSPAPTPRSRGRLPHRAARRGWRPQARAAGHGQDGSLGTGRVRCWGCRGRLIQTARPKPNKLSYQGQ